MRDFLLPQLEQGREQGPREQWEEEGTKQGAEDGKAKANLWAH